MQNTQNTQSLLGYKLANRIRLHHDSQNLSTQQIADAIILFHFPRAAPGSFLISVNHVDELPGEDNDEVAGHYFFNKGNPSINLKKQTGEKYILHELAHHFFFITGLGGGEHDAEFAAIYRLLQNTAELLVKRGAIPLTESLRYEINLDALDDTERNNVHNQEPPLSEGWETAHNFIKQHKVTDLKVLGQVVGKTQAELKEFKLPTPKEPQDLSLSLSWFWALLTIAVITLFRLALP